MRSFTTFLTFVIMALILNFCTAEPHIKLTQDISTNAGDLNNPVFSNIIAIPGNSTTDDTAPTSTQNKCYKWDTSEKWKDVGGQHSDFVNQVVYDLCQMIAVEAYKGFPAGNTIKHCKEFRRGSQGRDYDRSIGVSLRYTGPVLKFDRITAGYCNDRIAQPMACGAGGEFDRQVNNPNLPYPWVSDRWEAKVDPNRGDCRSNGYNSDLSRVGQDVHQRKLAAAVGMAHDEA